MDIVSINDKDYVNTDSYKSFMKSNNGYGYLRIRASAASQAIPISGVKVIVSKMIDNKKVVFFEGETDTSGMIMQIELPAPKMGSDNLEAPIFTTYQINALYGNGNTNLVYSVNIYDGITVVQNIFIVPDMNMMNRSDIYGY